jgi:hypothetical protein
MWHKAHQEDKLYQELITLVASKERNLRTVLQKEKSVSIAECTVHERGLLRLRDSVRVRWLDHGCKVNSDEFDRL